MGGGTPRASAVAASHPDRPPRPYPSYHTPIRHTTPLSVIPRPSPSYCAPLRHTSPLSVIPAQAGTHPPQHPPPPPIHPSPLPGGRLGGGWNAARIRCRCFTPRSPPTPLSIIPRPYPSYHTPIRHTTPLSVILRSSPSFLRRQEPPTPTPAPSPNSSLPPLRGEVRWGVGRRAHPLSLLHTPIAPPPLSVISRALSVISRALSVIPHPYPSYHAPFRHTAPLSVIPAQAGTHPPQHPPPPPIHPSPLPGGRLGGGWNPARIRCRCFAPRSPPTPYPPYHAPFPSFLRRQEPVIPHPYPSFLRRQEPTHLNTHPLPQFIPPPFQGGG